jgi:hypothetical protein
MLCVLCVVFFDPSEIRPLSGSRFGFKIPSKIYDLHLVVDDFIHHQMNAAIGSEAVDGEADDQPQRKADADEESGAKKVRYTRSSLSLPPMCCAPFCIPGL